MNTKVKIKTNLKRIKGKITIYIYIYIREDFKATRQCEEKYTHKKNVYLFSVRLQHTGMPRPQDHMIIQHHIYDLLCNKMSRVAIKPVFGVNDQA